MSTNFDFSDFMDALAGDIFEEQPVTIEQFVVDEHYLGLPPLSEYQYTMIKAMTQVYKKETLIQLYGEEEGLKRFKQTCSEVVLQLGKGSGKDYASTIACAYIVHLLLCLKDPARYFGKPPGDAIDIINVAINAEQAKRVFFKGFATRISNSPWFAGKFISKVSSFEFDKSITVHSGHSEREAFEGYNVIMVILDEISGFELESTSGNDQAKTASAIYKMYRASVNSRFPDFGKLILLSFPRFKNDYIQQAYDKLVANKEVVIRTHRFKVDPELPDGTDGNEFEIEWEEDHVKSYTVPKAFALKRPTWEINPTRTIEDFTIDFYTDQLDALSRFACMPPEATDAFFKSREKVETAFNQPQFAIAEDGRFADWFKPIDDMEYFVHVDLAQKHDHCAVSLAHVDSWVSMQIGGTMTQAAPRVIVDAVRFWTPTATKSVEFTEVKDFIIELRNRGFRLKLVTFDRWNSHDMMQQLKAHGINTELLSVAKKHYEDMAMVVTEERLTGPAIKLLVDELLQLRIIRDKVDHPRKGSKDLADAVCGAVYNAISRTSKGDREIKIHSYSSLNRDIREEENKKREQLNVLSAPKGTNMPEELQNALDNMKIL
jgi:hypothetical protein